ncbi:MAG: DUF368 domain-containing protein [Clostridiaceae bacterium]
MTDDRILEKDSPSKWLIRLIKGIAIGVGAILPGLSGGVLAVIFNLYEPILRFLGNMRVNFRKNMLYFIPVGLGTGLGIILFSLFVEKAFGQYATLFTCLFIGFVAGTLPMLFRTAGKEGRHNSDLTILIGAAVIVLIVMVFGGSMAAQITPSFSAWLLSGALIGLGVIIPGLSPSNFLIYLGLYDKMAAGISALNLGVIIPLAVGLILCVLLFAKGSNWLFNHHYSKMYHLILGTVIGSSLAIFPTVVLPSLTAQNLVESGMTLPVALFLSVLMFIVGAIFSFWFSNVEARYSVE